MSIPGLRLPIDIPWKRIGVSAHMMDEDVCDSRRPLTMMPSVAVFAYEPDEAEEDGESDVKISYLKVTCSVTGYGATNLDRLRRGRRIVSSPYRGLGPYSSYDVRKVEEFDTSQQPSGADLPCFAALLEVSVQPTSGDWKLDEYPYFSDFDPKKRELYELVSETGEVMSRTLEQTGVLHGGTTSTSNEVYDQESWKLSGGGKVGNDKMSAHAEGSYGAESHTKNVDSAQHSTVRSVDAGREARETYSHTTQLSQMYQLLTSYHLGTNRAAFFFEPRPHIVQPERTLIDGPRQLEGIQEFFLVVVRPREMGNICVNASLETLHVGTVIDRGETSDEPPAASLHFPGIGRNGAWADPDRDMSFPDEKTVTYTAPPGWLIDQLNNGGYRVDNLNRIGDASHKIEVTSTTVTIWGRVMERHHEGGIFENDRRDRAFLELSITIFLKPAVAVETRAKQFAILANTSVCTCRRRLSKVPPSIVREFELPRVEEPIGRPMRIEAADNWNKFFAHSMRLSLSSPDRYPRGAVGFWDLDVMREPLADLARGRAWRQVSVSGALADTDLGEAGLDDMGTEFLGRGEIAEQPVGDVLSLNLTDFVDRTGLDYEQAAAVRRVLWDNVEQQRGLASVAPEEAEGSEAREPEPGGGTEMRGPEPGMRSEVRGRERGPEERGSERDWEPEARGPEPGMGTGIRGPERERWPEERGPEVGSGTELRGPGWDRGREGRGSEPGAGSEPRRPDPGTGSELRRPEPTSDPDLESESEPRRPDPDAGPEPRRRDAENGSEPRRRDSRPDSGPEPRGPDPGAGG